MMFPLNHGVLAAATEGEALFPFSPMNSIAAGDYHVLALRPDGTVVAWGDNTRGQCDVPAGLDNVIAVAANAYVSVALKDDGSVVAWGDSNQGAVSVMPSASGSIAVNCGFEHGLWADQDGNLHAWGDNLSGISGNNPPQDLGRVTAFSGAYKFSAAVKTDGTLVQWGQNMPTPPALTAISRISGQYFHFLAIEGGSVYAWGLSNSKGELNVPSGLSGVSEVAAGNGLSLALKSDGTVIQWGKQAAGVPPGLSDVVAISAGNYLSVAVHADGQVTAWGQVFAGQTTPPSGLVVKVSEGQS